MNTISFFDVETSSYNGKVMDIGALRWDGAAFHQNDVGKFIHFIKDSGFICGHNIIHHDLKYLQRYVGALPR